MKVILMDDVDRVGHEGDVLEVADGYARNYLIPKSLAVKATPGSLKDLETRAKAIESREDDKRVKAQKLAEELATKKVEVKARAGEGQRIHGQVTTQMLAEAVTEQLGVDIDRRDIDIAEPIRELGDYLISAKLYKDVSAQLPVSVLRDEDAEEEEEQALEAEKAEAAEEAEQVPAEASEATEEPEETAEEAVE